MTDNFAGPSDHLEDVVLVGVPGQDGGGDEAAIAPAPDRNSRLVDEGVERDQLQYTI